MQKAYNRTYWENLPSDNTPIAERNLNNIEAGIDTLDDRIITLDTTKAEETEVSTLFSGVEYDEATGIITFTRKNGATVKIDTPLEKIALDIYYNPETEMLTLPLIDGTRMEVDLSRLITEFEFSDSDTIAFSVKPDGQVTAVVKEGSIEERHLQPNYLAEIRVETGKAHASAQASAQSESDSAYNAKMSQSYAVGMSGIREGENEDNAKYYKEKAERIYQDLTRGNVTSVNGKTGDVTITPEDIKALSTKKGGTVDNVFYVHKKSSSDDVPDVTQIAVRNGGKIAFNTKSFSEDDPLGNVNNSLLHLSGDVDDGVITIRGDSINGYSKAIDLRRIENIYLDNDWGAEINISFNEYATIGTNRRSSIRFHENNHISIGSLVENDKIDISKIYLNAYNLEIGPPGDPVIEIKNKTAEAIRQIKFRAKHSNVYIEDGEMRFVSTLRKKYYVIDITDGALGTLDIPWEYLNIKGIARISGLLFYQEDNYEILKITGEYSNSSIKFYGHGEDDIYIDAEGYVFLCSDHDVIAIVSYGALYPGVNSYIDLGTSSRKWDNIYAAHGTIQTSDRNEKNTIEELSAEKAQKLITGLKPSTYQINSGNSGRTHWGMLSQDIEELLNELGWTSLDFAGFIKSPKIETITEDEDGNPLKKPIEKVIEGEYSYSLRYDEFIAPMIKVIQTHDDKIGALEQKMSAMEQSHREEVDELLRRIELLEKRLPVME